MFLYAIEALYYGHGQHNALVFKNATFVHWILKGRVLLWIANIQIKLSEGLPPFSVSKSWLNLISQKNRHLLGLQSKQKSHNFGHGAVYA